MFVSVFGPVKMIMNYVLSFCKITAASRIFSRNFYLPLLKPITPKDALRTFKITGKWLLGSKIHHYIPVLFNHKKKRNKNAKDYGKLVHKQNSSYTYMSPILDPENENHKVLMNILNEKPDEDCFVYTVDDKMYNIVFPGKLELAIRDGDIIDILVSQSNDKILLKLKDFKKIAVELEFYETDKDLFKGEGGTSVEEEKFHHHGKMTMSLAKIFEAKELAEEWELEMMKIVAKKKKQKGEGSREWNEMVTESIQNLDWQQFEVEAKKVIDQIWEPVQEEHIGMQVEDLEKTRNVPEFILKRGNALLSQLPTMTEIPDVVKSMATAIYEEIEDDDEDDLLKRRRISGVRVTLSSGKECFITGQMVKTDEGEVFVPGQTIENDFGLSYVPGITINMDNKPQLIKGLIMGDENNQNPMFLPTESSITADGALTFCRNPEERSQAMPQKIFVRKLSVEDSEMEAGEGKKKKKKKKKSKKKAKAVTPIVEEIVAAPIIEDEQIVAEEESDSVAIEAMIYVEENSVKSEEEVSSIEEYEKKPNDDDIYKPLDDGMEKLIVNLEDKKSELQEKLDALRKLSITLENSVTYVKTSDAENIAFTVTDDPDKMHKFSDILLTITRRANTFRERNNVNIQNINNPCMVYNNTFVTEADEKFCTSNPKLKIALKSAMYAANEVFKTRPRDQMLALQTLSDILKDSLDNDTVLEELCLLMNTNLDRNEICTSILKELSQEITENKIEVLKSAVGLNERCAENEAIIEKIQQILDKGILGVAFKKVAKNNEPFTRKVIEHAKLKLDAIKTEHGAEEALQSCVASAAREFSEECLLELDDYGEEGEIKEFLSEALGLASTLGVYDVEEVLGKLLLEPEQSLLAGSKASVEFLKRFTLIKKLCEKDYSVKTSLERIRKHPECGRTDPRIRQLLRESASLTTKAREIRSSLEVPLRLFQDQNFLAIEDCILQKARLESPILISRKGIQAVIPKEAARNVLAGRVPYLLIDEGGVTNFKPMHMFSALKLGKSREQRFEDYSTMGGREGFRENRKERVYTRTSPSPVKDVRNRHRMPLSHNRMTA